MSSGQGDRLARGARSATFGPAGTKKTKAEWDAMFEDFNPKKFLRKKSIRGKKQTTVSTGLSHLNSGTV